MSKNGRPRKDGPRYPSGDLKPEIAPTTIKRVVQQAFAGAADWRLGTILGWMLMEQMISAERASAGWSYAKLQGQYDFEMGFPCRTVRSPSYGDGYRAFSKDRLDALNDSLPVAEKLYETDEERAKRVEGLKKRYGASRAAIDDAGVGVLAIVERTCMDELKPLYNETRLLCSGLDAYTIAMAKWHHEHERARASEARQVQTA